MTIKVGNQYIHTVLGYVDDTGTTVITGDPELATMTGKYSDTSAEESADPAAYAWEEIDLTEPDEENDENEDETGESDNDLLFRLAATQSVESVQENLVTGTNQGADGWQAGKGTIESVACSPEENGAAVNGVRWTAAANDTLARTADIAGEAVPESVTVSFWWNASAQCGLTVSIGDNMSEPQSNYDSTDLDEDGNALDLTDAWLFFRALIPIAQTADDYAVKVATDSAATISIGDFKVEPGDKVTAWTESAKAAMSAAQTADSKAQAAGDKATTADEKAQAAGTTAQAVQEVLNGLTVVDANGVTKVNGGRIDTDTLFAQDITATGSITGATLVGAKIQGNEFDITAYENDEAALPVGVHLHGGPDEVWEDGEAPRNFTVSVSEIADDETLLKSSLAMYSNQIILDAADIYILADDSQPYNAIQLKAPYVCVEGGTVDLYGTVAINDLKMFIGPGDTVTITRMYCAGGVTGSAKTLYFFIPMARPIIDVSSATLSNPSEAIVTARKSAGGYIVQNAAVESMGTSSCAVYENGVAVSIAASEAYSATNNTPAAVTIENLELTFS